MSDSAQGEGWWRASDGKWYPPQPSPRITPPPPPSSQNQPGSGWWVASDGRWYPPTGALSAAAGSAVPGRTHVSKGLSGTLQGFLWAVGGLSIAAVISSLIGFASFNQYWNARPGSVKEAVAADNLEVADGVINVFLALATIGALVIFILIVIWMNQAHKATQAIWQGPRSWSSGWTIGGWFIPFANAVIPKLVLNEIERIALAPRSDGLVTPRSPEFGDGGWNGRPTLAIGWVWWVLFVVGAFVGSVGNGMFDEIEGTPGSWRVGYWMVAVGYTALAVSSAAGAFYIRRISQALSAP